MPTTFTTGDDIYTVSAPGAYDLDFLAGDDTLNVNGGTSTTAHMGDGNDKVKLLLGLAAVFGDAGADKFDIWASNANVDGGADNDTINIRGGTGTSALGGLGADRFNFFVNTSGVSLDGGDGNDVFYGYYHTVAGSILGGLGNDYFVTFVAGTTLQGGLGNDVYRVTAGSAATFVENLGEGTDSVQLPRGMSYALPDNIEKLVVQGFSGSVATAATITGNALANAIVGHNNNETINGLDGNDHISSQGGNDTLHGGNGNDVLVGGTGTDVLFGDAGNDTLRGVGQATMAGGTGNDLYYVDGLDDAVTENASEGTDTVRTFISGYTLTANVENGIVQNTGVGLTLTGNTLDNALTGNAGADTLYGGDGADTLKGGAGNDTLDGGIGNDVLNGGTGDDAMTGGAGDDSYYVDSAGDVATEAFGQGTDTVYSSILDFTLGTAVENGVISVSGGAKLTGNGLTNVLTGGAGADQLYGLDGSDMLNGGAGNDQMTGGHGSDTYYVDSLLDLVTESVEIGPTDVVLASVSGYTLTAEVENGTLLVAGLLTGNSLDNMLTGSAGDDTLDGGAGDDTAYGDTLLGGLGNDTLNGGIGDDTLNGGTGNDFMTGGEGADTYYVESLGDTVDESGAFGLDTIHSYLAAYTLGATIEAGNVELTSGGSLTGNEGNNQLYGNSGDDVLEGLGANDQLLGGAGNDQLYGGAGADALFGGTGDDYMNGGTGNDSYTVDSAGDTVDESGGDGADTVTESLASYTMPAGVEFGYVSSSTDASLTGNELDNAMQGNAGNDTLYGANGNDTIYGNGGNDLIRGGAGADVLYGIGGADTFRYTLNTDSLTASPDTIQDFTSGTDKIDMSTIDANTGVAGDQAFTWTLFPTGTAGQWWFSADASTPNLYHLFFDFNGGGADMKIDVFGAPATTDIIG